MAPGPAGGVKTQELTEAVAMGIFETVATIVAVEDRITRGLNAGEFTMTFYPVRGQEIIPATVSAHLGHDDYMVTTYRGVHDCIAKGIPLTELVAEMLGKVTGTSKGKGGPMHLSDPRSGLMVTTGVVGAGLPIAAGLGLAAKLRGTDQVTVVNFGDGATSIGAAHEAANLAALWELPVIFVCQHNGYGEHTAFSDYTRTTRLAERFGLYGMAAVTCDGNSVPELYEVTGEAVERARTGGGPTFLECMTFRLEGHSFGATTEYVDPVLMAEAQANEPVGRLRRWLGETFGVTDLVIADVEAKAVAAVEVAVEEAKASPAPGLDELQTDIFSSQEAVPR
jgi:acetoin:2,6-dichlorophenolindophenol oxidoreductase subunit alpha